MSDPRFEVCRHDLLRDRCENCLRDDLEAASRERDRLAGELAEANAAIKYQRDAIESAQESERAAQAREREAGNAEVAWAKIADECQHREREAAELLSAMNFGCTCRLSTDGGKCHGCRVRAFLASRSAPLPPQSAPRHCYCSPTNLCDDWLAHDKDPRLAEAVLFKAKDAGSAAGRIVDVAESRAAATLPAVTPEPPREHRCAVCVGHHGSRPCNKHCPCFTDDVPDIFAEPAVAAVTPVGTAPCGHQWNPATRRSTCGLHAAPAAEPPGVGGTR